jgi:hypothetical protein
MGNHDGRSRVYPAVSGRRRTQILVVGAALAAVLGGGAYAVTTHLAERRQTVTAEPRVLAPIEAPPPLYPEPSYSLPPDLLPSGSLPGSLPGSGPGSGPGSALSSSGPASSVPASSGPPASARAGVPPRLPARSGARHSASPSVPPSTGPRALPVLPPRTPVATPPLGDLSIAGESRNEVSERVEHRANGSVRIVTARFDLAGQRELGWAGDRGRPIGDVRCTQRLHFSENATPTAQPNLLLCWRTSAARSVVTLLADYGGHPSVDDSVDIIDREWTRLG